MPHSNLRAFLCACSIVACTSSDTQSRDAAASRTADASDDAAVSDVGTRRGVCSGCATADLDRTDRRVRFHHVHLNVTDPAASRAFYTQFFDAEPVRLNGKADALWLAPMLFLLRQVAVAPNDALEMGLDHVGRGADDPVQWFDQVSKLGVMGDPRRDSQATPVQLGSLTFIYVRGPNAERMEVYNIGTVVVPGHEADAKQFQHVHFITPELDATPAWYSALLGEPVNTNALGRDITVDRTSLFFINSPQPTANVATDDRPLGHIAFSVSDLGMLRDRAQALGLEVVAETKLAPEGFRSFFVRAPDQVLIELVEAGPIEDP
jgi:catechol 2,3-dioxygenase-like lactoylglutathione lyase family enzyme